MEHIVLLSSPVYLEVHDARAPFLDRSAVTDLCAHSRPARFVAGAPSQRRA